MTRTTVTLLPKTEKWLDKIIGALRQMGIKTNVTELVNYMAWELQKEYVQEDAEAGLTDKEVKKYRKQLEEFRAEMKKLED